MSIIGSNILAGASGADTGFDPTTPIGTATEGGYFAGFISHTANGVATHALIVAPRANGATGTGYTLTTMKQWKTSNTATSGTTSSFDGAANTANMSGGAHPAADFCTGLSIGGYSDWYMPARYEYDIAYENLKPTTESNVTMFGINDYSVPKRTANRTSSTPSRTSVLAFRSGGGEAFVDNFHWSSTESSSQYAWFLTFFNGFMDGPGGYYKVIAYRVRAFRKVAL